MMNFEMRGNRFAAQQQLAAQLAAKMSLEQNAVDVGTDEPRPNIMGTVSRTVELQGSRICDVLGIVSLFLERFFGSQPEADTTTGAATPQPSGIVHEVERNLSRNDYLLAELEQKIRRLSDIA